MRLEMPLSGLASGATGRILLSETENAVFVGALHKLAREKAKLPGMVGHPLGEPETMVVAHITVGLRHRNYSSTDLEVDVPGEATISAQVETP